MSHTVDEPWLLGLPKVELHLHLEGSMGVETVRSLADRHGANTTEIWPEGLPGRFSFDGFPDFARQFFFGLGLLRSGEDLATATADLAATLAKQHCRYAEVTTTAYTHFVGRDGQPGMAPSEYQEGLNEGRRRARDLGVSLSWVIDIPRDLEPPDSTVTVDYLEGSQTPDGLVAIGLGGYEVGFPAAPYAPHFGRAMALGLHSVPHAGETEGAHSVRSAVEDLSADRIGHGVRCLEDPDLVSLLVERQTMLEVCPTSNDLLQVVESTDQHPLPALVEAGLNVSISTDDPGWFATDLTNELRIAASLLRATPESMVGLQQSALDASFAPDYERRAIAAELSSVAVS